jgi:hypothetical protein
MASLLSNPDFADAGAATLLVAKEPVFASGPSAAPQWTVASSSPGTTATDMLPGTRPDGAALMMHVCTTGAHDNGVFQEFQPPEGLQNVITSVWVFVVRGTVGIGTGNAASTKPDDAHSTTTGSWELLQAANKEGPPNVFALYSVVGDEACEDLQQGACFYFESPSVEPV